MRITLELDEIPLMDKLRTYEFVLSVLLARGITPKGSGWDDKGVVRAPLMDFANEMELKLRKNDHKDGWKTLPIMALWKLLLIEKHETDVAMEFFSVDNVRNELVDIANFAMMLSDRLSIEDQKTKFADAVARGTNEKRV